MAKPSGRRTSQFRLPKGQPQPSVPSLQSNFIGGLKTEFTGLNFPENACTDTDNCVFELTGKVTRRSGIDYEVNNQFNRVERNDTALTSFVWTNAGGDGNSKLYVLQAGGLLYFYNITGVTDAVPLSANLLTSTINLNTFYSGGVFFPQTLECEYANGNGNLFVFNAAMEPIICVFSGGFVTASPIILRFRDLEGILEQGVDDSVRPTTLTIDHHYNLLNQGWAGNAASLPPPPPPPPTPPL